MSESNDHNTEAMPLSETDGQREVSNAVADPHISAWLPGDSDWEPPVGFADKVTDLWAAESPQPHALKPAPKHALEPVALRVPVSEEAAQRPTRGWVQPVIIALAAGLVAAIGLTLTSDQAADPESAAMAQYTAATKAQLSEREAERAPEDEAQGDEIQLADDVRSVEDPARKSGRTLPSAPKAPRPKADPVAARARPMPTLPVPVLADLAKRDPPKLRGTGGRKNVEVADGTDSQRLSLGDRGEVVFSGRTKVTTRNSAAKVPVVTQRGGTAVYRFDVARTVLIKTGVGTLRVSGATFRVTVPGRRGADVVVTPLEGSAVVKVAGGKSRTIEAGKNIAVGPNELLRAPRRARPRGKSSKPTMSTF